MIFNNTNYSIIDLETTGLYPRGNDRIVEVSIKKVTQSGNLLESYLTLINPRRDLGPVSLHKISNIDIEDAPEFEEVIGNILNLINNTCLVAHNVRFDLNFLLAEFERANFSHNISEKNTLCTLKFANEAGLPRKLEGIQNQLFGNIDKLHTAENDTEVIKGLFKSHNLGKWLDNQDFELINTENIPNTSSKISTRGTGSKKERGFVQKLLLNSSLSPTIHSEYEQNQYAELIEMVIEDRVVNENELADIQSLVSEYGFTNEKLTEVHTEIYKKFCAIAFKDEVITDEEKLELDIIRNLLSIDEKSHNEIMKNLDKLIINEYEAFESFENKLICFSGDIAVETSIGLISRKDLEKKAEEIGAELKSGVSKKLDLLVVADVNTQSGKAKKARIYDTRIMSGKDFAVKVGYEVTSL